MKSSLRKIKKKFSSKYLTLNGNYDIINMLKGQGNKIFPMSLYKQNNKFFKTKENDYYDYEF